MSRGVTGQPWTAVRALKELCDEVATHTCVANRIRTHAFGRCKKRSGDVETWRLAFVRSFGRALPSIVMRRPASPSAYSSSIAEHSSEAVRWVLGGNELHWEGRQQTGGVVGGEL